MDNRPGKHRSNSKLTDQYLAGRGRALKEFSRRSPKAEEVKMRKQLQHLIISGQIMLDKETIDKYFSPGKNGSTCGSVSPSSSQQQFEESESDSCTDLTNEKYCSKAPVGSTQWQQELQIETIFNNNLENHMEKLNIVEDNNDCDSDHDNNIPPRFRNSQFGKNFKRNKPWINRPMQNGNDGRFVEEASWRRVTSDQPGKQEPSAAAAVASSGQNQQTSSDPWNDWEASVVVQAPIIDDEDLEELVVVDDNDTMDDVMVQQYVNALHQEQLNGAANVQSSKITPSRIQELGNLKSTTNADSVKVPPGTLPNPPKGPDRWGGSELKGIDRPTGWGDIVEDSSNWYDDGSTVWSSPAMPYGASGGWSWNS